MGTAGPQGSGTGEADLELRLVEALREGPRTWSWLVRFGGGSQRAVTALLEEWAEQGRLVEVVTLTPNRAGVRRQRRVLELVDPDQAAGSPAASDRVRAVSAGGAGSGPWPGAELAAVRARLGWSLRRTSQVLAVDRAQVAMWERGQVPAPWVGPVQQALAAAEAAGPAGPPHRPAVRCSETELRRFAKNLICSRPGLTRARVTAQMAGTSMTRRRAIVEDLIRDGQVLEYREGVEYADGRVLRLRVLRCP